MRKAYLAVCITLFLGCDNNNARSYKEGVSEVKVNQGDNILAQMTDQDLNGFEWMNPPKNFSFQDSSLQVLLNTDTDFFNNPEDGEISATAPFLYYEIEGDFVATSLLKPDFSSVWNACALMVHQDSTNWIKFAFENSDATGKSIVSVVTKELSDDANGPILNNEETIWLRIIRKKDIYAMHWSEDGINFNMARLTSLPSKKVVKIGIEAQCPIGKSARHEVRYLSIEQKTVKDLRKGI